MPSHNTGKDREQDRREAFKQVRDTMGKDTGRFAETHIRYRGPGNKPTELNQQTETAEDFAKDIAPDPAMLGPGGHVEDSYLAVDDKDIHELLPQLSDTELRSLPVVQPGTRLEQGGIYADLNRLDRGPFKAMGGEFATKENRYIAKRDVDYQLWNRLVGQDAEPQIERPSDVGPDQQPPE